jgi:hypothetical protein
MLKNLKNSRLFSLSLKSLSHGVNYKKRHFIIERLPNTKVKHLNQSILKAQKPVLKKEQAFETKLYN